ncbi:MAG: MoaD/ThiS family protein [Spirochaetes bacterium]|nr:MoaD/ThiS family protein [Spirochaetota bacterium]
MKIRVKAFASIKDILGFDEKELTVSDSISVSDVVALLEKCYPGLKTVQDALLYARNEEYCRVDTELADEDTLAIFPHVSGG